MGSETIKIIKQLLCGLAALFPSVFYKTLLPSLRSLSFVLPAYVCCFPSPLTSLNLVGTCVSQNIFVLKNSQ